MATYELQPQQDANNYDTQMSSYSSSTNYATSNPLGVTYDPYWLKTIMKFDLSSVSGTVTSASLTLNVTAVYQSGVGWGASGKEHTYGVGRILSGNSDWVNSQATWNVRKTGTSWAGSAGCSTSGTDYDANLMGTLAVSTTGSKEITLDDISEVQAMVDNNYGMVLFITDPSAVQASQFTSMDDATEADRPKLTIVTGSGSVATGEKVLNLTSKFM